MGKKPSLKDLALAPDAGFRSKSVTVPEWGGITVIIREPSGEAWIRWRNIISPQPTEGGEEDEKVLTPVEEAERNLRAGAVMFVDVIRNEDGSPAFTMDNLDEVIGIYGPVHNRLVNQAFLLSGSYEEAEKK